MSFILLYTLVCDNCGADEVYHEGEDDTKLPDGWEEEYDDGDAIFAHVCDECVKDFEEEAKAWHG